MVKNSELLIVSCGDPMKWYANLIGKRVPLLSEEGDHFEYRSVEPAGYVNFVNKKDAVIVDIQ